MAKITVFSDLMKKHNAQYVDLRFTDLRGKLQHITHHIDSIEDYSPEHGIIADVSCLPNANAEMALKPDFETASIDPFFAEPTVSVLCDLFDPRENAPSLLCPRAVAHNALNYLKKSDIGSHAYFGPEVEFFVFDRVRYSTEPMHSFFALQSSEAPLCHGNDHPEANSAHRSQTAEARFPINPVDSAQDIRTEMISVSKQMGVDIDKHIHNSAAAQHALTLKMSSLTNAADVTQTLKYIVHNVSAMYGKTATFMPKPVADENGSGLHLDQSLWKDSTPLFAGNGFSGLSEQALHYIGGILAHARALGAITNPSTNSYKRLSPGLHGPVILGYGPRNPTTAVCVPFSNNPKNARIQTRFPDSLANPYLAYAAMLMAGIDGIKNKIDPGKADAENASTPTVCGSLHEAIAALEKDHAFLTQDNVFTPRLIETYLSLKRAEWDRLRTSPHPVEFDLYYSA